MEDSDSPDSGKLRGYAPSQIDTETGKPHRVAELAHKIAAKACLHRFGSYNKQDSRYLDAFSFAQVDVLRQLQKKPERSDKGVVKIGRTRLIDYLAHYSQSVRVKRRERDERKAAGLEPIYLNKGENTFQQNSDQDDGDYSDKDYLFPAAKPTPDAYSRCRDEKDREIVDWYTTRKRDAKESRSQKECAKAVGLSEDKTIERLKWLSDDNEPQEDSRLDAYALCRDEDDRRIVDCLAGGSLNDLLHLTKESLLERLQYLHTGQQPKREPNPRHKADPENLRKLARGKYGYARLRWYCCDDQFDVKVLRKYLAGKNPRRIATETKTTVHLVDERLRHLAYRALLM